MRFYITICFVFYFKITCLAQSASFDVPIVNLAINKGFDYANSFVVDQKPHMFCYDSQTGKAAFWNLKNEVKPNISLEIGKDWDFFSFVNIDGKSLYLFASSNTGRIRLVSDIFQISSNLINDFNGLYSSNWSFVNTLEINNTFYLVRYRKVNGAMAFNKINVEDSSIDNESIELITDSGWDKLEYLKSNDSIFFLKQNTSLNRIVVEKTMLENTKGGEDRTMIKSLFQNNQRLEYEPKTKFTHSTFFCIDERIFLMLYNDKSGELQILSISPNLTSFVSVYKTTWSKGWTNFNVIYLSGKPYLFHQKESNGLARISKISIEL